MLVWLHRFLVFRLARGRRPWVIRGIIEKHRISLVFEQSIVYLTHLLYGFMR